MRQIDPMNATKHWLLIASLLALTSCGDRRAFEPTDSLVGASNLPPARELRKETITINLYGGTERELLEYELRPDNRLTVTHYESASPSSRDVIRAQEVFRLSSEIAERARRSLWRLRPTNLEWPDAETLPEGCPERLHSGAEFAVAFIRSNERLGVFALADHCENREAEVARSVVQQVLQLFPNSEVATAFPRPA